MKVVAQRAEDFAVAVLMVLLHCSGFYCNFNTNFEKILIGFLFDARHSE